MAIRPGTIPGRKGDPKPPRSFTSLCLPLSAAARHQPDFSRPLNNSPCTDSVHTHLSRILHANASVPHAVPKCGRNQCLGMTLGTFCPRPFVPILHTPIIFLQ